MAALRQRVAIRSTSIVTSAVAALSPGGATATRPVSFQPATAPSTPESRTSVHRRSMATRCVTGLAWRAKQTTMPRTPRPSAGATTRRSQRTPTDATRETGSSTAVVAVESSADAISNAGATGG